MKNKVRDEIKAGINAMDCSAERKERAILLIETVENALLNGVKCFDKDEKLLTETKEILRCLLSDGFVTVEKPKEVRSWVKDVKDLLESTSS